MRRAAFALPLVVAACGGDGAGDGARVELERADGSVLRAFTDVARAATPEDRARGLVGRGPLTRDAAMVLDYPVVDEACITNAEVDFPITAVFVTTDGAVRGVESLAAHDARVPCHEGVITVVEADADARADAAAAARVRVR